MENIEAAVREDDALATRARLRDRIGELGPVEHSGIRPLRPGKSPCKLRPGDNRRAGFSHDEATCDIRNLCATDWIPVDAPGDCECCRGGITCAGHVINIHAPAGNVLMHTASCNDCHAISTAGHYQRLKIVFAAQCLGFCHQLRLVSPWTNGCLKFLGVGFQQARSGIAAQRLVFRIDNNGYPLRLRECHQCRRILQCAFVVVLQDNHSGVSQILRQFCCDRDLGLLHSGRRQRRFEIRSQQLLLLTHHPQFDNGRPVFEHDEITCNASGR